MADEKQIRIDIFTTNKCLKPDNVILRSRHIYYRQFSYALPTSDSIFNIYIIYTSRSNQVGELWYNSDVNYRLSIMWSQ